METTRRRRMAVAAAFFAALTAALLGTRCPGGGGARNRPAVSRRAVVAGVGRAGRGASARTHGIPRASGFSPSHPAAGRRNHARTSW